ncbi:MAG: type I glyceraldehyde-3-phosphate dehydrogenase [Nanoarchaeota archaeon]|nr:type I glyceraldehyde-3-phosphate dehydrogenase [Nanoarchaeota archaeon]
MKMKVAINGFGRIGRAVFKIALEKGINVVAINDPSPIESLVYLLKHDTVYGRYNKTVSYGKGFIKVGSKKINVTHDKDPENLPWKKLKVDVVAECTGIFKDREGASKHLTAGAKKVLISAPGKDIDRTIVLGINEKTLKKTDKLVSNASCTTNCLAPVAKVLEDNFGIQSAFMTTVHAYTGDQRTLDSPHKKLRRGRAAAENFIPTSSGATTAVAKVIPSLAGKMDGLAIRGPILCGSIVDFTAILKKSVTREDVNSAMRKASRKELKGILGYSEEELVSSDIISDPRSSVLDSILTQANGKMVKVLSWYDNEYGYSCRMVDLLKLMK